MHTLCIIYNYIYIYAYVCAQFLVGGFYMFIQPTEDDDPNIEFPIVQIRWPWVNPIVACNFKITSKQTVHSHPIKFQIVIIR